jgi:chloramphenicol 3-O phosphotransferase
MHPAVPFLHIALDACIGILPKRMVGHPDGLTFDTHTAHRRLCVAIGSGPVVAPAMRGMRHAVAAMAAHGNNLIVDAVMLDQDKARDHRDLLSGCTRRFVALFAPLEVLEEREPARGERMVGLVRWPFDRVHRGMTYDLAIDTSSQTPEACARLICATFGV